MTRILKSAGAAALIGAAALASVTPSEARNRWIGPAAAGFAAGAIVGSARSRRLCVWHRAITTRAMPTPRRRLQQLRV